MQVSSGNGRVQYQSRRYREASLQANTLQELSEAIVYDPADEQRMVGAPSYSLSKFMMNRAVQLLAQDTALTSRRLTINAVTPGRCRWASMTLIMRMHRAVQSVEQDPALTSRQPTINAVTPSRCRWAPLLTPENVSQ